MSLLSVEHSYEGNKKINNHAFKIYCLHFHLVINKNITSVTGTGAATGATIGEEMTEAAAADVSRSVSIGAFKRNSLSRQGQWRR